MDAGRRRLIVVAAAIVMTLLTARLGWWQLDRAGQKIAIQRSLDERGTLPALGAADLVVDPHQAAQLHHRAVALRGHWLTERTLFLDNRPMAGRAGFIVVTPLALEPGPGVVLVQRGWVARDAVERTRLPAFVTPQGSIGVTGRIAGAPSRLYEFGAGSAGPIRQNLDLVDYAREIGVPIAPLTVIESDSASVQRDGLLRQWPQPAVDVHKHYGYAVQWFALAALVAGLTVWFQFIRPRLGRAR
jgi:surfeit locus 1 family protein